jgi:hypothetical protein
LQYAHEDLRKDLVVVATAVSHNGLGLKFALDDAKKDRAIVMIAVCQNGLALEFADTNL